MSGAWGDPLPWWLVVTLIMGAFTFFMTPYYLIQRLDQIIARLDRNANLLREILEKLR